LLTGQSPAQLAGRLFAALVVLSTSASAHGSDVKVRFAVPDLPPYITYTDQGFEGSGVALIRQMASASGLKLALKSAPNYGRAWKEMQLGRADGVALETRTPSLSRNALFVPLPLKSQRCWFVASDAQLVPQSGAFRRRGSIAAFLNSGAYQWLLRHQYRKVSTSSRIEALPLMLLHYHRVQAVLAARAVFDYAASAEGLDSTRYRCIPQSRHQLGVYISSRFASQHPDAYRQLRRALKSPGSTSEAAPGG